MIFIYLSITVIAIFAFNIYTQKFYNPYKLILYYGKKGCGKSTVAQKLIWQHYRKGWNIYVNNGDSDFRLATQIDASKLWEVEFKPHSLLVIDEVNLLWDNRQFKSFPKELLAWFRLQRHHKVKCILFSQTADADKKIRDLTDRVYLVKRWFQVLICCVPYEKDIVYREPKKEFDASGFMDVFEKRSFGPIGCTFCWLPKWVKFHDSFKKIGGDNDDANDGDNNIRNGWYRVGIVDQLAGNKKRRSNAQKARKGKLHKQHQSDRAKITPQQSTVQPDPRRSSRYDLPVNRKSAQNTGAVNRQKK